MHNFQKEVANYMKQADPPKIVAALELLRLRQRVCELRVLAYYFPLAYCYFPASMQRTGWFEPLVLTVKHNKPHALSR